MGPLRTAHLLPLVDQRLIHLLRHLDPEDWQRPTIVPGWTVKHVAAHLLDTAVRKLSVVRDGAWIRIPDGESIQQFINRLNAEGVAFYTRSSPQMLISLLETVCRENHAFHAGLDPYAPAAFAVSWAGEQESLNWFDTARELTERWHHQQQIRLAVPAKDDAPGITTPELYHPVLDCFLRALPYRYRNIAGEGKTHLAVEIAGDCGGSWYLCRSRDTWDLLDEPEGERAAAIRIPQEIAWRIFTKGISLEEARQRSVIEGDAALAEPVLGTIAIVG